MPLTLSGNGTVSGVNTDIGMRIITPTSVSGGSLGTGGKVTFSFASTLDINNVFSSSYDNYRCTINFNTSAAPELDMQFLRSGSLVGSWYAAGMYINYASPTYQSYARNGGTNMVLAVACGTTDGNAVILDIFRPYENVRTNVSVQAHTTQAYTTIGAGHCHDATNNLVDGIRIVPSSGAISGTIRIYGYNNG